MPDTGILFLHYDDDPVTKQNLESFRRSNPHCAIVPISSGKLLEGGVLVPQNEIGRIYMDGVSKSHTSAWRNCDLMAYAWYQSRKIECSRWIMAEWDCFCTMNVNNFFRRVSDMDFVAPSTRYPSRDPEWGWFREINRLGKLLPYAMGVSPFCGCVLSDRALSAMSEMQRQENLDCFCDMRLATLGNACGFPPAANPHASGTIGPAPLNREDIDLAVPAIWHPVKFTV